MQADSAEKEKAGNQHSKGSVKNSKLLNTRPHKESSSAMKKSAIPGDTKNSQGSVSRTSSRETSVNHRTTKKEIASNSVGKQSSVVKDKKLPDSNIKNKISSSSNSLARKHPPKTKESSDGKVVASRERTASIPSRSSLDNHDHVPVKRSTDNAAKVSGIVSRRISDKKDQNLKFKGGGSSNDVSDTPPAKTNLNSKNVIKPSVGQLEKKRIEEGKIRVGTSGVSSVDKRMGQMQKLNEKKSNSVGVTSIRSIIKDSSESRMKENFKKVLSEQVKKSSYKPSREKSESSSSVKNKEQKVSGKISSEKIGRERTRTWTITSNAEDVENGRESRDPQPDVPRRGEGDGPSVQRKKSNVFDGRGDALKVKDEEILTACGDGPHVKNSAQILDSREQNVIEKNDLENNDGMEDYNYEDDFEDYESDFEECTDESDESYRESSDRGKKSNDTNNDSSDEDEDGTLGQETEVERDVDKNASMEGSSTLKEEEEDVERKLDSGLYDSGRKKRQEEENIPKKLPRVDADEGFEERQEEEQSAHDEQELVRREAPEPLPSSHCISCEVYSSNRGVQKKEVLMKAYARGNEVLKKITLDEISYSLLDLPPIPYESFMKCRGHLNTKQISTQTNEDSHSESVQTDAISTKDAWTQKPPVMGQAANQMDGLLPQLLDNGSWIRLGRFVETAGEVMAILLEEQWSNCESLRQDPTLHSSSFSKFSLKLGQDGSSSVSWESLLSSRPVLSVCFCRTRSNLLLCSHGPATNFSESKELHSFVKGDLDSELNLGLLTVWSISEPSFPYKLLSCQSCVSRSCFQEGSHDLGQVVFAGADDGSISVWDLYEKSSCCKKLSLMGSHEVKALCPTFTTYSNETHLGRIVGLEPIFESDFGDEDAENNFSQKMRSANQICSLDQWGLVIVWSVIRRGVSVGKVSLVASMKLCLSENGCNTTVNPFTVDSQLSEEISLGDESCNGIALWNSLAVNFDWILAASDTGNVVCLPIDGELRSIRVYPASKDSLASAECIAVNPQGLPFFMVGNYAGQVHMYSHSSTRTFGCWETPSSSLPSPIMKIAWSPQRPFVFFTIDALSRMHIWDLARSDIFPIATIQPPKDGRITDISLSFSKGKSATYMALGMDNGQVILHQLNEELTNKNQEISKKEVLQFIKYTNLL